MFNKEWSPYTHSVVLWNPSTNGVRQFTLAHNLTKYWLFKCGDLSLRIYKYYKEVKPHNLFVADKGGILNNFINDMVQDIENQMMMDYDYHYL